MASAPAGSDPSTQGPAATVQAFADAWGRLDFQAIESLLAPDVRYSNGPLPVLHGRGAVMAYLRGAGPFESCRWEMLSVAVAGSNVLTERVDHLVVRGTAIALPVMGAFEVQRGLIREWRDYFDLSAYRAQWPG